MRTTSSCLCSGDLLLFSDPATYCIINVCRANVALMGKKVTMNCAFGKDNNGNEFNKLTPSVSGTYRAVLLRDNNAERGGARWVQSVMQESAGIHV